MAESSDTELKENTVVLGERNYEAALNLVIARAEKELLIFDDDFSKGDYASIKRFDLIRDFLASGPAVKLVVILQDAERFSEKCPRLFKLLETYSHCMTLYQASEQAKVAKDMFIIADQQHYVRRFHIDQARFRYAFDDVETASILNMRFDELLQLTSYRVSAAGLGL